MKKSKLLFTMLPVVIGAVPVMAASCVKPDGPDGEKTSRFDTVNDNKLSILSGFSEGNSQGKAIKTLVDAYNEYAKTHASEGYLEASILWNPNGYDTGKLVNDLRSTNKTSLYNIMINYPAAASIIAQYDMNIAVPKEKFDALNIVDAFTSVTSSIVLNDKNENWVVPISRSTEMIAINQILFGKLLNDLVTLGAQKVEGETEKIDKWIKAYTDSKAANTEQTKSDAVVIDEMWDPGKTKTTSSIYTEAVEKIKTFKLSDKKFENYKDLIEMVSLMKKLYISSSSLYVLGIDSVPNAINAMIGSITKNDLSKHYIKKDASKFKSGGYDYTSFFENPSSPEYARFKEVFDVILEGINSGAIWIGGSGAYGSNNLVNHKLALSMGSTSGYSHTYVSSNSSSYFHKEGGKKFTVANIKDLTLTNGKLKASKDDVYWSTDEGVRSSKNKYVLKLLTSEADAKVKQFMESNPGTNYLSTDRDLVIEEKTNKVYAVSGSERKELVGALVLKSYNSLADGATKDDAEIDSNYSPVVLIPGSQLIKPTVADTLQKHEADWISMPLKATSSGDETFSVFTQGPSFVLLHANETEDPATIKFIEWFYTHNFESIQMDSKNTYTNITPIDAFNQYGSYVSPTKSFFASTDETKLNKMNEAQKIAFNNFKKVVDNPNQYKSIEDIPSTYSDRLRKALEANAKALVNTASDNPFSLTYNDFIKRMSETFKIDN
ncbi:Uncharacterized lipoprotein MPN_097 precursor [Metamycoplasma cloacale]|nr:P80 family lipoprotein [Metamycoplasma cloacale]VEU79298.1 Uncharacterized lipoprotein MPN_097 precursor [Metamycoplasma cloacale]